jgi:hypothetical protein
MAAVSPVQIKGVTDIAIIPYGGKARYAEISRDALNKDADIRPFTTIK